MITSKPYTDALAGIAGPTWLAYDRRQTLETFLDAGLPGPAEEDWRYTSLAHLERQFPHAPADDADVILAIEDYPGNLMAFVDGRLIWQDIELSSGRLGTLEDADPQARRHLGSLAGDAATALLNAALWQQGACLHVPAHERLRQPVFLRFAASQTDVMLHPRVLVVMEADADAILIEHYCGDTDVAHWQNAVTEIVLAAGARLTHIRLLEAGGAATHTHRTAVRQERDSRYRVLNLTLGGRVVRHDLQVALAGEGAQARLDGLFVVDGRNHADHHLRVAHEAPRTASRTLWRGIAAGRSRGIFDARVLVRQDAVQAEARQSSRNLLLSPYAEIDCRPQLEIYTDDVKCSHGATVGQLDEDALFYLRSRGIGADAARAMLLSAFADDALALAEDAGLRDWIAPRLAACLPGGSLREVAP